MKEMKKLMIFAVVSLLLGTFLTAGCEKKSGPLEATLGKSFTLAVGQTALIESEDLKITFKDVTDDSRCPRDAQCVWAGIANCVMEVTLTGTPSNFALVMPGGGYNDETYEFGDYTISFNLKPYPDLAEQIQKSEYLLSLKISKKGG